MSSQEARETRRKRQSRGAQDSIDYRNRARRETWSSGPPISVVRRDPWSEEYSGEDPHDDEYFQDRPLDFNEA